MKPTYEELEQKLEESRREFRAADATIHNLELKLTDMAVQLANAESKCRGLAVENAGLKNPDNWLSQSDYGYEASEVATQNGATEDESLRAGMIAIINRIGTPATDAFLAEVTQEEVEPLKKEIEGLKKQLLMSVGDIRDLIDYNPENGVLTAKVNFSGRQAGSVIGSQTWQGYYAFSLFGKKCFAHRLAWLLHYGEWPSQPIDHINGIKTDNSIRNLRLCSLSQNQFNKPTQKNNTTGVKGVYWNKRDKRYVASVQFNGKKYSAGHHKDIDNAKEAVMKLREKLAGEFTNHGEFELAAQLRKGVQS
ncbi:HNH endonuclease [Citrobacter sp. Cf084]|uniref:HNH endonuclease n=1 Tax=Citrobacter sp. Cf084 TaxID=2985053 RepID=UPI0025774553|nr:HNH endonuclease [Citrobacter sp. Cf084]EKT9265669.1 HNH endonuclease [Citrobacter freundii]EKU4730588.1 HNH endonuclease [Citrobacter freundii]EKV2293762.1 HNH endonuclease [Citrobacter freundii]EKW0770618.1 HNH endonuclease [Citrobacter freundii]MDM3217025.1 HNH endonuclease [Citrobacter sp. Cf084]